MKILKRAVITEKSSALREASDQVVFEVAQEANKREIKVAIEKAFNVKVSRVNTMVVRRRLKTMGKYQGLRPGWKKALVTLKPGQKIELFEGV